MLANLKCHQLPRIRDIFYRSFLLTIHLRTLFTLSTTSRNSFHTIILLPIGKHVKHRIQIWDVNVVSPCVYALLLGHNIAQILFSEKFMLLIAQT